MFDHLTLFVCMYFFEQEIASESIIEVAGNTFTTTYL